MTNTTLKARLQVRGAEARRVSKFKSLRPGSSRRLVASYKKCVAEQEAWEKEQAEKARQRRFAEACRVEWELKFGNY